MGQSSPKYAAWPLKLDDWQSFGISQGSLLNLSQLNINLTFSMACFISRLFTIKKRTYFREERSNQHWLECAVMYKTILHTRTSSKWEKILYDENAGNRHDSFIKDIQYYCHTIPSATVWGTAGKYQMTIGEIYNPRHWERWEVGEFKIFHVTGSEAQSKRAPW